MTVDKAKLRALAEAANAVTTDVNITMAVGSAPEEVKAVEDFLQQAMPKTILALIEEIERIELVSRLSCNHDGYMAVLAEIDQLKAKNEELRKAVAGKVVCDLDLFEDLRDSAASEADEHRQHMATYRPQRQQVLDWTVKRCDLLLAAAKEVSHD